MTRATKAALILPIAAAVLLAGAYALYLRVTYEDLDLTPLEPYSETERYEALYARVHAQGPAAEGFKFVALGDTRSFYARARKILERAVEEKPAFILSNGDLVRHGTVDEYLDYHLKLVEAVAPIPFIPAPGNHEEGPNRDFAAFKALYGDLRFSFDYGNCRFVGVNNGDFTKLGGDDLRYLEAELSKPGVQHKFVVIHAPPEFLEEAVGSRDYRGFSWNARKFHALMVAQGVDQVFSGHVHGFATEVIDGVRYTITGGGGANLTEDLGERGQFHHFILVSVTPEGLKNEVVKLEKGEWKRETIE